MNNRKELKFLLHEKELSVIEKRILNVLSKDPHQEGDHYLIRSVYFDSPDHFCFRQNAAGVDRRRKYRIRSYNCSPDYIKAEIKSKLRDTTWKESARLTPELYQRVMEGERGFLAAQNDEAKEKRVFLDFTDKILSEGYRPSCIVEYERSAYCYEPCNVRVTFDRNIRAGRDFSNFFSKEMVSKPACQSGVHVLEVKYDEFLPDFILELLLVTNLQRSSFSKFYIAELECRHDI